MSHVVSGIIPPQIILDAFGQYKMGFAQALVGSGGPDDGRFFDLCTDWRAEVPELLKTLYLNTLVAQARRGGHNFMEFWGWPEFRHRDDGTAMVYSRLRMMHIIVIEQPRMQ